MKLDFDETGFVDESGFDELVFYPSWSPLVGGRQSADLPDWSCCGAQRLGKTSTLVPSRWTFAQRHMLGTGELMWTSLKRVGTRRINPSLAP